MGSYEPEEFEEVDKLKCVVWLIPWIDWSEKGSRRCKPNILKPGRRASLHRGGQPSGAAGK